MNRFFASFSIRTVSLPRRSHRSNPANEGWPLAANLRQFESAKPLQKRFAQSGEPLFVCPGVRDGVHRFLGKFPKVSHMTTFPRNCLFFRTHVCAMLKKSTRRSRRVHERMYPLFCLCRRAWRFVLFPRKTAAEALAAPRKIPLPHLRVGGQALEGAANPQMAGQSSGYEQALQKAHAGEKTHAADSAGASSDD